MKLLKVLFIILALLTTVVWSYIVPFNEGPDEYTHLDVANFIAQNNRFPVFGVDENMGVSRFEIPGVVLKQNASYSAMPPLAYFWQSIFIKVLPLKENDIFLSARFANNILIVIYSLFVWKIAEKLFNKQTLIKLLFSTILVFSPQIIFTFSYVNSDAILLVFSSILGWWTLKLLVDNENKHNVKQYIVLGISIGLAVLSRYNIAPMLFLIVGLLTWKLIKKEILFKNYLVIGFVAGVISLWWYVQNPAMS